MKRLYLGEGHSAHCRQIKAHYLSAHVTQWILDPDVVRNTQQADILLNSPAVRLPHALHSVHVLHHDLKHQTAELHLYNRSDSGKWTHIRAVTHKALRCICSMIRVTVAFSNEEHLSVDAWSAVAHAFSDRFYDTL